MVGLVQLAPGATTTNHRLALLVAGAALLILGELSHIQIDELPHYTYDLYLVCISHRTLNNVYYSKNEKKILNQFYSFLNYYV